MAYITGDDITARVGTAKAAQLSTDSGGTPDATVLSAVAAQACAEVNRWVSKRRPAPVDTTGDSDLAAALQGLALDIAEYRLHSRRPPVPDTIKKLYEDALAWLGEYVAGKVNLPGRVRTVEYRFKYDDPGPEDMN